MAEGLIVQLVAVAPQRLDGQAVGAQLLDGLLVPPPPHEIGARTSIELGELGGGTRFHAAGSVVKVVSDLVDALRRLPPSGVPPRHL